MEEQEPYQHPRTLQQMRESEQRYKESKLGSGVQHQPTEEGKTYLKSLREREKDNKDFTIDGLLGAVSSVYSRKKHEFKPYPILHSDFLLLMNRIIDGELQVIGKRRANDIPNNEILNEFAKYFAGCEHGKLNLNKGIYFYGPVGRGKTVVMRSCAMACSVVEDKLKNAEKEYSTRHYQIYDCKAIVKEVLDKKNTSELNRYDKGIICLDDLGAEDAGKLYGNTVDVVGEIITRRYVKYQQTGTITHATSNIPPEQWVSKYGDRVSSRMHEMFNLILIKGEDKRLL